MTEPSEPETAEPPPAAPAPGAVALAQEPDFVEDENITDPNSTDPDSADPDSADPDSADPDSADPDSADPDWAWVAEWRASGEKTPWAPGIALGAFMLVLVASAIFVLTAGVSDTPWLAITLNVLVAGGIGPQLWLARNLPVLRFIAWGAALGVLAGWLACFVIPFPT